MTFRSDSGGYATEIIVGQDLRNGPEYPGAGIGGFDRAGVICKHKTQNEMRAKKTLPVYLSIYGNYCLCNASKYLPYDLDWEPQNPLAFDVTPLQQQARLWRSCGIKKSCPVILLADFSTGGTS